ncbi:hypothetical protein LOM8899_03875 [Flavimaricola marinus]|uniref:Tip attachment protein J domain-containing protein n=1 Tax=Flavimaricola marinus TaxID=1819565 RepID=A0A238LJJ2_9RHOB|nr:hypothetical protein LOM8899_03875 [Flavimaricola marinus]
MAGVEGYDWYYHSPEALSAQIRTPIEDFHGEDWVWRYKDIKGWSQNQHRNRINGVRQETPTAWEPKSKPIWFTEIGCAAIDKGTNEPNKFLDPKSSESFLPRHSNGLRDDFIQMQYLRAIHRHFADDEANPVSDVYGGAMVDMARAHVWAWDARPYPAFPLNTELWSDGANYARGHWINGRSSSRSLASVVAEICERAGIDNVDTSRLYGVVRGYQVDDTDTARSALQVLMVAYGFDAIERDGILEFRSRDGRADAQITGDNLVYEQEGMPTLELTRAPSAEVVGTARVGFVDADGDYEMRAAEAIFPDDALASVNQSELPLALTTGEGRRIAERWLAEARVARDTARFGLPPSGIPYGAGDVLEIDADGRRDLWRIDRVETTTFQEMEAVRVEPETYRPNESMDDATQTKAFVAPVPVEAVFLDLPLLTGEEQPHAPHVAMTSEPWPGQVALYSAPQDNGYVINKVLPISATVGSTQTNMAAVSPGRWDRGPALRVKLVRGSLRSVSEAEVLSGLNLAAIGDGQSDTWEVFQFANAELVGPNTYDITLRLRGQAGSDGVMPQDWPEGSRFVLLDGVPTQIQLASSARDVTQHYRWGPAQKPIDDSTYRHLETAFRGIGLRPYSVCHLRADSTENGDLTVSWIRRTRTGGDSWNQSDVPLGETTELYDVSVTVDGVVKRQTQVSSTSWLYTDAMQTADGTGEVVVSVAQVSESFGPGPARSLQLASS